MKKFNEIVRDYWEQEACGTSSFITGNEAQLSKEWFERVEAYRYSVDPIIHSIAQFTRHQGKRILEVGVGAGTDHLQWARAGADCYGVDLTEASITTTEIRLSLYGLESNLQRADAESLPFSDDFFDLVYAWGVIHHSENPAKVISEIRRVLRQDGLFIGMIYHRYSLAAFTHWIKYAVFRWQPWKSFSDVIWEHMESIGTKAYTISEAKMLFSEFNNFTVKPLITFYDKDKFPLWLSQFFPDRLGWFLVLHGVK